VQQLFDLSGKVAAITGAGSGIGRAIAALFGRQGARVVALDLDETAARETADAAGLAFYRTGTVAEHPAFIRMLGDLVLAGAVA